MTCVLESYLTVPKAYIDDNNYLNAPVCTRRLTRSRKTLKSCQIFNFYLLFADHVPFAGEQLQKKGLHHDIVEQKLLKYVKDVSCVELSFVQNVKNAPVVVPDLPLGARLHQF